MGCKNLGVGFAAGVIVGAMAGLIFAPKKGEELRTDIKVKATDAYDKVVSYDYAGVKDNVINKFDDVKHKITEIGSEKFGAAHAESSGNVNTLTEELIEMSKPKTTEVVEEDEDLFEDL